MTMSRQLPALCGRKGRNLCVTDTPAAEATDSLFLAVPPGTFSQAAGVTVDADVKPVWLWSVVVAELSS